MRKLSIMLVATLLTMAPLLAQAVKVNSIYKAEVPVATQSAQDKTQAIKAGLAQVLTKVSGNSQVLDNPGIQSSMSHSDALAQEFSYAMPKDAPSETPYLLTIRYDAEGINRLLRDAGATLWGQNRPLILVWLALDSPDHPLDIVDSSTVGIQKLLHQDAKLRGLPLILPVMDMTDINAVSASDVVSKALPKLQLASKRYDSNAILIGHITQTKTSVNSQWELVLGTDTWDWNIPANNLQDAFSSVIKNVADTLASRYAAVVSDSVQSQVTLKISGVTHQDDLMQVMRYLQHLTSVGDVLLTSVDGNVVTLDVSLRSSKQSFMQALAIGKNLVPNNKGNPQDETLFYQWTQ